LAVAIDAQMTNKIKRPQSEVTPQVGIFWLCDGKPLIDRTLLAESEDYGAFKTHPRSHLEAWSLFQKRGIVPADVEYEEQPRGRVMYNTKTRRFTILADRCILKDRKMLARIMSEMKLPIKKTDKETDSHYRCSACLRGRAD
jgi:hypothetical protein